MICCCPLPTELFRLMLVDTATFAARAVPDATATSRIGCRVGGVVVTVSSTGTARLSTICAAVEGLGLKCNAADVTLRPAPLSVLLAAIAASSSATSRSVV